MGTGGKKGIGERGGDGLEGCLYMKGKEVGFLNEDNKKAPSLTKMQKWSTLSLAAIKRGEGMVQCAGGRMLFSIEGNLGKENHEREGLKREVGGCRQGGGEPRNDPVDQKTRQPQQEKIWRGGTRREPIGCESLQPDECKGGMRQEVFLKRAGEEGQIGEGKLIKTDMNAEKSLSRRNRKGRETKRRLAGEEKKRTGWRDRVAGGDA